MSLLDNIRQRLDATVDGIGGLFERRADDAAVTGHGLSTAEGNMTYGEPEIDVAGRAYDGSVVVNGIRLPMTVADQLRNLGISLNWYSASELEAAVRSCSVDCTLVDDHHGLNYRDSLELSHREQDEDNGVTEYDHMRPVKIAKNTANIYGPAEEKSEAGFFGAMVKGQRDRKKQLGCEEQELFLAG